MAFPHQSLKASGGRVYAYLFENRNTGLPRGVYWGASIDFEPLVYGGETRTCSMTCDWIPWKERSWRALRDKSVQCRFGDQGVEASFYFMAHDCAETVDLAVSVTSDGRFDVAMSMAVDFSGWMGDDKDPAMPISGRAIVPFEGIWMDPSRLDPAPSNEAEAKALAAEFLELRDFRLTESPTGGYLFLPRTKESERSSG